MGRTAQDRHDVANSQEDSCEEEYCTRCGAVLAADDFDPDVDVNECPACRSSVDHCGECNVQAPHVVGKVLVGVDRCRFHVYM